MVDGKWKDAIEPIAKRFDLAVTVNGARITFNAEGSAAMASLIRMMADKLDVAVERDLLTKEELAELKASLDKAKGAEGGTEQR